MKLVFYGNCQAQAAARALQSRNRHVSCDFAGNSEWVPQFDPERSERLMDEADIIITQPIMNMEREDNHQALCARFGDRAIFTPYIFIDGLHSLSLAGALRQKLAVETLFGGDILLDHLRRHGVKQTMWDFRTGKIDFRHQARFDRTLAEMRRREQVGNCKIRIADEIEQMYRSSRVMLTHNHPSPDLINILAGKVAEHIGLDYSDVTPEEAHAYSLITLPVFETIVSPWCKEELGLTYPYDLQWFFQGRDLILKLAETYEID